MTRQAGVIGGNNSGSFEGHRLRIYRYLIPNVSRDYTFPGDERECSGSTSLALPIECAVVFGRARRSAEPQTKGFGGGMPFRLRIRLRPAGSWVRRQWGWQAPKLLLEIIVFCEKDAFSARDRRSLVCPLAVTWPDYLPARRLNRVGADPGRFAQQRAGIRFR
jgi:hypothetical protein